MKFTIAGLKQIIKEEIVRVLKEGWGRNPDADKLAQAMWSFMRDSGMKSHVSAEGTLPVGKYLVDQLQQAEEAGEEGDAGDLYRRIPGSHRDKIAIMSRNTIRDLLATLSADGVYKIGDDSYIVVRRGEDGAVIGNEEFANQHRLR